MKQKLLPISILGLLSGVALAVRFVNPYTGVIALSEIPLQLSGSRGDFAMGINITEQLSFILRFVPAFIFELLAGMELYQHFCTASVYLFSRTPDRLQWYLQEICSIVMLSFTFQFVLMAGAMLTTMLRYHLEYDMAGLVLFLYQFFLLSLWDFSMAVLINLIAVLTDSSVAFVIVAGTQLTLTALLILIRIFENDETLRGMLMKLNPMAHLVLGWHGSRVNALAQALHSPYGVLSLHGSLLLVFVVCTAVTLFGALLILQRDLLLSNSEIEV